MNLYSVNTIAKVASAAGYEITSVTSVIDEIKPIVNYLSYDDPYFGEFPEGVDFGFLTPELIHNNLLGYKLQVILVQVD